MQGGGAALDVEVDHDGGVRPVRAAGGVGVPTGFDEPQEPVDGAGQRRRLLGAIGVVVGLPVGDQRVVMGFQGRVEGAASSCGKVIRQLVDTSVAVVVIERCRFGPRLGIRAVASSLTAVRSWWTVATAASCA